MHTTLENIGIVVNLIFDKYPDLSTTRQELILISKFWKTLF